jgi:hypothetical protein
MKHQKFLATLLFSTFGTFVPAMAQTPPPACNRMLDLTWIQTNFSDDTVINSIKANLTSQKKRLCGSTTSAPLSFPPGPPNQPWEEVADDLSGFVNIYRLSGDPGYKDLAQFAADWLLAWNDYLVLNRDPSIPYLGWYVESRTGYFNLACAADHTFTINANGTYTVDRWRADEAWDTAAAVRGFLKYSEIDPAGTGSVYFQRAQAILDNWPFRDHASNDGNPGTTGLVNDGPYAAAGMRWFAKSNEPCEIRYVKNTNLVMGEQLFRVYRLSQDPKYLQAAIKVLDSQLWEIETHRNFGYDGFMIYVDQSDPIYNVIAQDRDRNKVIHTDQGKPDDTILCRDPAADSSCWNHLGFEAYDLYQVQQLIYDLTPDVFPVPDTQLAVADALGKTMTVYRSSIFGSTATFPWQDKTESQTHITAYNCAQRFSTDPIFGTECVSALGHSPSGGTIFYSLVPDGMFTQGPAM